MDFDGMNETELREALGAKCICGHSMALHAAQIPGLRLPTSRCLKNHHEGGECLEYVKALSCDRCEEPGLPIPTTDGEPLVLCEFHEGELMAKVKDTANG